MKKTITLKKNYEFKYILNKGKYFSGNYIDAFVTKNNTCKNKLGIAVSVKLGKAIKRNKIKRLIRENYRLLENDIKCGYNIVFLWKKKVDISKATYYNIKNDMKKIFKRIGIL